MADSVVLSVQLTGAEAALSQLTQLDAVVKSLKANRNIQISVNARSLATAAQNAEKLNTGLNQSAASAKQIGTAGAKNINNAGESLGKASKNAESFRLGMASVVGNMLKFRLASSAINLVFNAFKSGFEELKKVDTELVNIRKVTGFAKDEIDKLTKSAYSLATNYGRSASEVLEASTVFARAGYTDQIEQLSELSLLLQNVGDLQADEASKFIIATDKAYKLGGSYDNLMTVLDGLDNITNKNATDMQKMTEGMTVAGSVFAESGESIETFAALLGTATADTQRSGSEVARGLRTILMNLRQIRGETEDGELIDGESIAAAAKALKDYAGISTMENGQLRKASDILAELSTKWKTLSETQQAAIAEAVGGKRQANILMALMGDWKSVEKMMEEYTNAAGTAAKENAAYMDSWAAKTEQVKAAWSELIATATDTDAIKDSLDGVITFLDTIKSLLGDDDSLLSRFFSVMGKGIKGYADDFKAIFGNNGGYVPSVADRNNGGENMAKEIEKANAAFAKNQDIDAYVQKLQKVLDKYKDLYDYLNKVNEKAPGTLTANEQNFLNAYNTLSQGGKTDIELYGKASAASAVAVGKSWEEAAEQANKAMASIAEELGYIPNQKTIDVELSGAEKVLATLASIKDLLNSIGGVTGTTPTIGPITGVPFFASGTKGAPGGPALVNEKGPELLAANGLAWIAGGGKPTVAMLPQGTQVYTASQTRRMLGGIPAFESGTYTDLTAEDLDGSKDENDFLWDKNGHPVGRKTTVSGEGTDYWIRGGSKKSNRGKDGSGEPGGGGGGSHAPDFKTLEKGLSDRLKNLDLQAKLAENEEDFLKAMQVYGEAQDYIAELLEMYRANGYADDSDEVLRLANLGYDYAAKQLGGYDKLQQNLIDALNALTKATDDANALAERREAVDKAREALANADRQRTVRIFNPVTGQWEWVANASDVSKAQENLKNAEEALRKEELSQAIEAIKNAKPGELGDMTLSPAILEALFGGTPEQQSAFLNALGAATGGADWLSSSAAQTAWNQGNSIGTQYNLNGITLTEAQASNMTIKDLIALLQGLKIM